MQTAPSNEGEKDNSKVMMKKRVDNLRKLYRTVQPAIKPPKKRSRGSTSREVRDLTKSSMIVPRTRHTPLGNDDQVSECSRSLKTRKRSNRTIPPHEKPISKEEQEDTTIFENDVKSAARVVEKPVRLRWKKGYEPDDVEVSVDGLDDLTICEVSVIEQSPDYRSACKILAQTPPEMAESLLTEDENRKVRHLFKRFERRKPTRDLVRLLQKAMRTLLSRLITEAKITFDDEMKVFLTGPKCDAHLMDMVLLVPEFMPDCWGGEKSSKVIHIDGDAASKAVHAIRSTMRPAQSPVLSNDDSNEKTSSFPCKSPENGQPSIPSRLPYGLSSVWSAHLGQLEQKPLPQRNGRHRGSREKFTKDSADTVSERGKRRSRNKNKAKDTTETTLDDQSKEEGSDAGAVKKPKKIRRSKRTRTLPRSASSDERSEISCETENTVERNDDEPECPGQQQQKKRKTKTSRKKADAKLRRGRSSASNSKEDINAEVKREVEKLRAFDQPENKTTAKPRGASKIEPNRSKNSKEDSSADTPKKEMEKLHLRADGSGYETGKARTSKCEHVKTKSNSKEDAVADTPKREIAKSPATEEAGTSPLTGSDAKTKKNYSNEEIPHRQQDDSDTSDAKQ